NGAPGEVGASDAARLFADRARNAQPQFDLTDAADAVETIVRRLDGIPLAIELAAARIRVLSVAEIATALTDQLTLLRGVHRRSDPRHRTMRASLDWSYGLLGDRERAVFARLSIFPGTFDRQAAAAVCPGGDLPPDAVAEGLEDLVDKSLLVVERGRVTTRFRMLDFVREYARECLAAVNEDALVADLHRRYFRGLAERADRERWALDTAGRSRIDDEAANFRAAIDHGCANDPEDALAIVVALGLYWRVRGRAAEGLTAIQQTLAAAPTQPSALRARALAKLSYLAQWVGDFALMYSSATEAMEIGLATGDAHSRALALERLAVAMMLTEPDTADPMLEEAATLARAVGDQVALCDAQRTLVVSHMFHDDRAAMQGPLEEALTVAKAIGDEDTVRWCLWSSGHAALAAGELARARADGEQGLAMMEGADPYGRYCLIQLLAILDAITGAPQRARQRAHDELDPSRWQRLRQGTAMLLHALAVAALADGDLEGARQWADSLYDQEGQSSSYFPWLAKEVLASVALANGDAAAAEAHVDVLLVFAERLRNRRARSIGNLLRARALLLEGSDERAEALAQEALGVLVEGGWRPATIDALDVLSQVATFRGQHERAVRLIGAARAQRDSLGLVAFPTERDRAAAQLSAADAVLGADGLQKVLSSGAASASLDEVIPYAEQSIATDAGARRGWASLSPTERKVVELAARGLSNPDIAREAFMSRNTVKAHLSRAFAKLGVANRTELAAAVARHTEREQND
ncbi:MAG TPA: LuxR C-terminal-related transcriptional regulator, partial [Acidimicrobiales bacterium]|nr:LuxR C-terminal-related transcriptional regulator [Acidimicrobiales bacterium]